MHGLVYHTFRMPIKRPTWRLPRELDMWIKNKEIQLSQRHRFGSPSDPKRQVWGSSSQNNEYFFFFKQSDTGLGKAGWSVG